MVATAHNPERLIAELTAAGVRLEARGVRLVVDAPRGVLSPAIKASLLLDKQRIIASLRLAGPCDRCGSAEFHDVPIHDGRSIRRDCATCGRTLGFPKWTAASTNGHSDTPF